MSRMIQQLLNALSITVLSREYDRERATANQSEDISEATSL